METIIVLAIIIVPVWLVLWVVGREVAGALCTMERQTKAEAAEIARAASLTNRANPWDVPAEPRAKSKRARLGWSED